VIRATRARPGGAGRRGIVKCIQGTGTIGSVGKLVGKRNNRPPRLVVIREPSGRLSRSGRGGEEPDFSPAAVRRLRDAALAKMTDQRWGSSLGQLYLAGKLDEALLLAGERWAELAEQYYAAINAPRGARSACLERGSLAASPDPDSEAGRRHAVHDRGVIRKMLEAHGCLTAAGLLGERIVRAVCERNESAPAFELVNLERGLGLLADFWRLTARHNDGRLSK
jgi:hypothetical protein